MYLETEISSLRESTSRESRRLAFEHSQIATNFEARITTPIQKVVYEVNYRRKPVDFHTFVNDPYFLGAVLRRNIFPAILVGTADRRTGSNHLRICAWCDLWHIARITRIHQLLDKQIAEHKPFTIEDMERIQQDSYSLHAERESSLRITADTCSDHIKRGLEPVRLSPPLANA